MIIFDETSCYFNNFNVQEEIKKKLSSYFNFNDFISLKEIKIINKIPQAIKSSGYVYCSMFEENCYTYMLLSDDTILKLMDIELINNKQAIHIIHHEFCHITFLETFYQNKDSLKLYQTGNELLTKDDLLFELGFTLYNEYYAYRISISSYINIKSNLLLRYYAEKSITAFNFFYKEILRDSTSENICIIYNVINENIKHLFYSCCREIGYNHASNGIVSKDEIDRLANFDKFENWINNISNILSFTYSLRLKDLIKKDFISIGNEFMVLYNKYNIHLINDTFGKISFTIHD